MNTDAPTQVSANEFRQAMSTVCSPVSIVTTSLAGHHHGTTVSAFMSLSLEPPAVLISLSTSSSILPMVKMSGVLGLNVLGAEQAHLAKHFATKSPDKFAGIEYRLDGGLPRLAGSTLWARCRVTSVVQAYDHDLVYAVLEDVATEDVDPLLYFRHRFTQPLTAQVPSTALVSA
ncbi:flavin reductase family protein [Streptomyces sp. NPDC059766]|uniref:flavin reductase family protein n=1 Tax=Streptomyces sp. NPDC059766 TaxID=3346940 RepID=UPI0036474EE5